MNWIFLSARTPNANPTWASWNTWWNILNLWASRWNCLRKNVTTCLGIFITSNNFAFQVLLERQRWKRQRDESDMLASLHFNWAARWMPSKRKLSLSYLIADYGWNLEASSDEIFCCHWFAIAWCWFWWWKYSMKIKSLTARSIKALPSSWKPLNSIIVAGRLKQQLWKTSNCFCPQSS